jgi:hypothetical protein
METKLYCTECEVYDFSGTFHVARYAEHNTEIRTVCVSVRVYDV